MEPLNKGATGSVESALCSISTHFEIIDLALSRVHNIDITTTQADTRIDLESMFYYVRPCAIILVFFLHPITSYCEPAFTKHVVSAPLDDLFQTPPSSPPSEEEEMTDSAPIPHPSDHLPQAVHSAINLRRRQMDPYERYLLRLSDLQVLVGKAGEDTWKDAIRSGHSPLHLLDKFTLSFQIQRYKSKFQVSLFSINSYACFTH